MEQFTLLIKAPDEAWVVSKAAEEKNAENLLLLKSNKPLVERYIRNFESHKGHAEVYQGK